MEGVGCWEQLRNAPHTSTNILCALRPALEPPSPHPSFWHLLQGSFLGLDGGGIGGLRADSPHARESAAGHSTGLFNVGWLEGHRGGACSLLIQFVYTSLCSSLAPKRRPGVCCIGGALFTHMWRLHRAEQVGCVIQAPSPIHRIVAPFCSPTSPLPPPSPPVFPLFIPSLIDPCQIRLYTA